MCRVKYNNRSIWLWRPLTRLSHMTFASCATVWVTAATGFMVATGLPPPVEQSATSYNPVTPRKRFMPTGSLTRWRRSRPCWWHQHLLRLPWPSRCRWCRAAWTWGAGFSTICRNRVNSNRQEIVTSHHAVVVLLEFEGLHLELQFLVLRPRQEPRAGAS